MQNFPEQTNCSIHNQTCVAIHLAQYVNPNDLLLCVKCMADKLSLNNSVILVEEAVTIIQEHEIQTSVIKQSILKYQTSITKIQEYIDWQNEFWNKILIQINSEIESLQSQLNLIKSKIDDQIEPNLQVLGQIFNGQNINYLTNIKFTNYERSKEFFVQIEKQFQCLKQDDKIQLIFDYFNEVIDEKESEQELIKQRIEELSDLKIRPFLKYRCSKHDKEIIGLTLEESCQGERILCVDCILKCQYKMITLEDADKLWLTYQDEQYDSENKFLCKRKQKYCESQKIMIRFQRNYQQLQEQILQLIQIQNKGISNQIQDLQKNNKKQSLMQLELKDLKDRINQLSQKDQFYQLKQQQMNLNNFDQQNQKEIVRKLCEIELLQKDCKQELCKLFNDNDASVQEIQIQIQQFQNDIQNQQLDQSLFTNLMPKFKDELLQSLLVLMKGLRDKGQQYVEYLNKANSQIKNKELVQKNIQNFQNALTQFDRQYNIIKNEINQEDEYSKTEFNLKVDSRIINTNQEIDQQTQLSINSINTLQIKCKINRFGLKDQLIQTNNKLSIDSQIIRILQRIQKIINLSINQINEHKLYYYYSSQFSKLLKFSQNLKHSSIMISADGKTAKSTKSDDWYLCLIDQPIPKHDTIVVDFKVKQSLYNNIMAGVCLKDSINKDYGSQNGIGKGCYLLQFQGYIFSHHDNEKQCQKLGFPYQQNDIISMEVNVQKQQITWRNKAKNQVYTLDIQTTSDLYFCLNLCDQNEIELL